MTEQQRESLKRLASETGRSLADLTREALDLYLGSRQPIYRRERVKRAMQALGKHFSGLTNVSRDHDRYLAEAYCG